MIHDSNAFAFLFDLFFTGYGMFILINEFSRVINLLREKGREKILCNRPLW